MTGFKNTALGAVSALACTVLLAAPVAADDTVAAGKSLYLAHGCYSCHGYKGVGKRPLSPATSGIVSNDDVFLIFLRARADVKPALPKQWMPHYPESTLPDEDALAILAYIRSFDDNPPSIAESATLSSILDGAR